LLLSKVCSSLLATNLLLSKVCSSLLKL
jgi:hypothetical protein